MKLQTTIPVLCSQQGNSKPYTGIIIGEIISVVRSVNPENCEYEGISINYIYKNLNGSPLISGVEKITKQQEFDEWNLIKDSISTELSPSDQQQILHYNIFKKGVAEEFEIEESQITIL